MKPLADCRLYAFVDTAYLRGRAPELLAQQLCDGGADLIQLRAKTSPPDDIRRTAEKILPITRAAGVYLVINDHLDLAEEIGAEICHLGQEDFFDAGHKHVSEVRSAKSEDDVAADVSPRHLEALAPTHVGGYECWKAASEIRIGLSTHAPAQAERAVAAGADYVAIGPVFATGTKPTAKPVTLDYVRWAAANVRVPWFAIGGINLQNLDAVLAAGAQRVCVVSAILNANDVAAECRKFRTQLG
jgi:thiamine-phosphate pyrophosphorylase